MSIFKSSKIVNSKFNVKKSTGPDVFNVVDNSKNVSIVGKQLNGDVITFTGNAADYAISASVNNVAIRFVNDAGKFVTVKFSILEAKSVTLAFADGGFVINNLLGKGKIAIDGALVGKKYLSVENYLDLDGLGDDRGALLNPALATSALDSINTNPVFTSANTITVDENEEFTGQLVASDADIKNVLEFTLVGRPDKGIVSFDNEDGSYTYRPNDNFNGTDSFVVQVDDGKGGVVQQTITVTVNPVNDAPVATADTVAVTEDATLVAGTVATNDSDVDGDTLTYALAPTQAPVPGLTFNSNGSFLFDPKNAAYQSIADGIVLPVEVSYTVTDGKLTTSATLTLNILGTNDVPVFTSATTATVLEDNVLAGQLLATDVDEDKLDFTLDADAAHGSVVVGEDGAYTYTPDAGFSGSDSFTVEVSDGVDTVKQTVTVTVAEGDIVYSLTDGVDVLTGLGVRNIFQETVEGQFGQDDIIAGGQFDTTAEDMVDDESVARASDDTLLLRSDTVTDVQFSYTTGIERLVMNSDNGTGNDTVTLGEKASAAGIVSLETRGGDDVIDVSAMTTSVTVDAGDGIDTLIGGAANDNLSAENVEIIDAGAGDDIIRVSANDITTLVAEGGDGVDTLVIEGVAEEAVALDLNDDDSDISGFENVDASALTGSGINVIANDAGSTIFGSVQADIIVGGSGPDVIRGGLGADVIKSGSGENVFVYVGKLTAEDNALYADFSGEVAVGDLSIDVSSVVTQAELTALKSESDVVVGESLESGPDDLIVIFGDVDMTLVSGGPFAGTFVVNSTLTLRYDQINNDTKLLGGLLAGEQTPTTIIITDIPVGGPAVLLDTLQLAGVEKLVLEGENGESLANTPIKLPVFDEEQPQLVLRQIVNEKLVEIPTEIDDLREPLELTVTELRVVVKEDGVFSSSEDELVQISENVPDVLILGGEEQLVDLDQLAQSIVVIGNESDETVLVDLSQSGDKILMLGDGLDTVDVLVPDSEPKQAIEPVQTLNIEPKSGIEVRFVSAQVGNGTDNTVLLIGSESTVIVNDESTVILTSDQFGHGLTNNQLTVQGVDTSGAVIANQNRGQFSYVVLGTEDSDFFDTQEFGNSNFSSVQGNVYINAGAGDDVLDASAAIGQRHFLVGGTGNDEIEVSSDSEGTVVVLAGEGDDFVELVEGNSGNGSYQVSGGSGRDTLYLETAFDEVSVGSITGFEVLAIDIEDTFEQDLGAFSSNTTFDTIQVEDIYADTLLFNVGDSITKLELVDGDGEDLEYDFSIERLNDTRTNAITIKTQAATEENGFNYEVEDGAIFLNDEELITIDTGAKVANGYVYDDGTEEFNTSDLEISALFAADLNTLTILGDGDVDIENLSLGTTSRVVKIDASGSTGDINIYAANNNEGISIDYVGSSGENDIEGTDSDDIITVVSDADDNDIEGNGGDDVISFTGNGLDNDIEGDDGDDTITVNAMFNEDLEDNEYQIDIEGGDGDDSITVTGTAFVDIEGGGGDDTIVSGDGDDRISGGSGADTLTGGEGKDTFVYFAGQSDPVSDGFDTITDFDVEDDIFSFVEDFGFSTINILDKANLSKFETEAELLAGLAGFDTNNANIGQDALLFIIGDDGYLFVDTNNNDQYDVSMEFGNDVLIKLVGVTDINDINFVGSEPSLPERTIS